MTNYSFLSLLHNKSCKKVAYWLYNVHLYVCNNFRKAWQIFIKFGTKEIY